MATARTLAWIDRLAWTALYVGLFAIVLGIVSGGVHVIAGWSLGVLGAVAVAAGVVLIIVRSRLPEPPPGGAQSSSSSPQGKA
jgi:hypothetical protein